MLDVERPAELEPPTNGSMLHATNGAMLVPDFAFQLGKEKLNWQILAAIDLERVIREVVP